MTLISSTSDENVVRLMSVFHDLVTRLPPQSVALEFIRTKNDDATIIWLNPSNTRAAKFSAHIEDHNPCLIDVSFGS